MLISVREDVFSVSISDDFIDKQLIECIMYWLTFYNNCLPISFLTFLSVLFVRFYNKYSY